MTKIFRLPPNNPIIWQRGLIDSEIDTLLIQRQRSFPLPQHAIDRPLPQRKEMEKKKVGWDKPQKEISSDDDVCPICYEDFSGEQIPSFRIVFCGGCGNNVHRKCMKVWMRHREKSFEDVTCPLCRCVWDDDALQDLKKSHRPQVSRCDNCKRSIKGEKGKYHCNTCTEYVLCRVCFRKNRHPLHTFRRWKNGLWSDAHRPFARLQSSTARNNSQFQSMSTTTNNSQQILNLQYREIDPNDYELLLEGLEDVSSSGSGSTNGTSSSSMNTIPRHLINLIPELTVTSTSHLINEEENCSICFNVFSRGEKVRKLPECSHHFHTGCIDTWLGDHGNTCPVCNDVVFSRELCRSVREGIIGEGERLENMSNNNIERRIMRRRRRKKKKKKKKEITDNLGSGQLLLNNLHITGIISGSNVSQQDDNDVKKGARKPKKMRHNVKTTTMSSSSRNRHRMEMIPEEEINALSHRDLVVVAGNRNKNEDLEDQKRNDYERKRLSSSQRRSRRKKNFLRSNSFSSGRNKSHFNDPSSLPISGSANENEGFRMQLEINNVKENDVLSSPTGGPLFVPRGSISRRKKMMKKKIEKRKKKKEYEREEEVVVDFLRVNSNKGKVQQSSIVRRQNVKKKKNVLSSRGMNNVSRRSDFKGLQIGSTMQDDDQGLEEVKNNVVMRKKRKKRGEIKKGRRKSKNKLKDESKLPKLSNGGGLLTLELSGNKINRKL